MIVARQSHAIMAATRYLGPAKVKRIDGDGRALLCLESPEEACQTWAQLALSSGHAVQPGDTVLAIGEAQDRFYIIGLLSGNEERNGERDGEKVQPPSDPNPLRCVKDPKTGATNVYIDEGDLHLITRRGGIHLISAGDIKMTSLQQVQVQSRLGIRMAVADVAGRLVSCFTLKRNKTKIATPEVELKADKAQLNVKDTKLSGQEITAKVKTARLVTDRLETTAKIDRVESEEHVLHDRVADAAESWKVKHGD